MERSSRRYRLALRVRSPNPRERGGRLAGRNGLASTAIDLQHDAVHRGSHAYLLYISAQLDHPLPACFNIGLGLIQWAVGDVNLIFFFEYLLSLFATAAKP